MTRFRDPYGQEWFAVDRLPHTLDLSLISQLLHQQGVPHRVTEEGNQQVVWVTREEDCEAVKNLLTGWRQGEIQLSRSDYQPVADGEQRLSSSHLALILRLLPGTFLLLLFSLCGYLLVIFDSYLGVGHWFTIVDISQQRYGSLSTLDLNQIWRLWTPMFLHFDILHFAFNALFLWVFGARVERAMGRVQFLLFVLAVSLAANLGQLMWEGNPFFGGMSGVNYGLIGYIWLRQMLAPHPMLNYPKALIPFLLVMLLLGVVGVLDIFIQGRVANAAHVAGLLAGMSWGALAGFYLARQGPAASQGPVPANDSEFNHEQNSSDQNTGNRE